MQFKQALTCHEVEAGHKKVGKVKWSILTSHAP